MNITLGINLVSLVMSILGIICTHAGNVPLGFILPGIALGMIIGNLINKFPTFMTEVSKEMNVEKPV